MFRSTLLTYLIFVAFHASYGSDDDTTRFFYRHHTYGSMALVNPLQMVLSGSFDILQLDGKDRRLLKKPYGIGFENVFKNCFSPGPTISQIGWGKWITTEVLPLNFTAAGAQWVPNYQLHLIGGGMSYRMLSEWYREQGIAGADCWSAGTVMFMHVLNEAVENEDYRGYNSDPIADILLFDWLGILLFTSDDVSRFFGETLHMRDWSNITMITFPDVQLGNGGQYYSLKWNIPNTERWSVFYMMGMSNMAGVSYKTDEEHSLTLASGIRGRNLTPVDPTVRQLTLTLVPTGGVFWDRNHSLLASLTVSGQQDQSAILQLYPGLVKGLPLNLSLWAMYGTTGGFGAGLSVCLLPGLGYRKSPR